MQEYKDIASQYNLKVSALVLATIAAAFFPRVLVAIGFPAIVNFLHFVLTLILCSLVISRTSVIIWQSISKKILLGLYALLLIMTASALLNSAGVINLALDFVLLSQPFAILLAITSIVTSKTNIKQMRFWLMCFAFIHFCFFTFQYFILKLRDDDVKGVFLGQGAGHHVGGAIALTAGMYFFMTCKFPLWIRLLVSGAFAANIVYSDSKQVLVACAIALVILLFTKLKNFSELIRYLTATVILGVLGLKGVQIFFAGSLGFWGNSERLTNGLQLKFSVFSIIGSHYHSYLNWLFGLGPGHTIGRLAWLISDYAAYLKPLGITSTPVTSAIFVINDTNPLSNAFTGSSMFALTFSWAGIWGDLGILGLVVYLSLWFLVWQQLCLDNISKFFLLNTLVLGAIFSWLEEPSYMLFIASAIGLQWHENRLKQKIVSTTATREDTLIPLT